MNVPTLAGFDHFHVHVRDRAAAERWYARVLGLQRVEALAHWAQGGGPLTLTNANGSVHLALFQRPPAPVNHSTLALRVTSEAFETWRAHLAAELPEPPTVEDHGLSRSIYFSDPDGNPYELSCWERS
jgi:catechol-2,3-dioxygenase